MAKWTLMEVVKQRWIVKVRILQMEQIVENVLLGLGKYKTHGSSSLKLYISASSFSQQ